MDLIKLTKDAMVQNEDLYKSLHIIKQWGIYRVQRTLCRSVMMSKEKVTQHNVILREEKQKSRGGVDQEVGAEGMWIGPQRGVISNKLGRSVLITN